MAYIFQKMIFIGQNLKHAVTAYSFLKLLIFFWLTLLDIISHQIKEILYINTNSKGNQSWNITKRHTHHLSLILLLKTWRVKISNRPGYCVSKRLVKLTRFLAAVWISRSVCYHMCHLINFSPLMPGGNKKITHT